MSAVSDTLVSSVETGKLAPPGKLDRYLLDLHSYLYILVKITLDFIRAEDDSRLS